MSDRSVMAAAHPGMDQHGWTEAGTIAQHDRRRFPRYAARGEAELYPLNEMEAETRVIRVQLREISRTGLGFFCAEPLAAGSQFRVNFVLRGYRMGHLGLIITHCEPLGERGYVAGGQVCIESGLMNLLDVHPAALDADVAKSVDDGDGDFLAPEEL